VLWIRPFEEQQDVGYRGIGRQWFYRKELAAMTPKALKRSLKKCAKMPSLMAWFTAHVVPPCAFFAVRAQY